MQLSCIKLRVNCGAFGLSALYEDLLSAVKSLFKVGIDEVLDEGEVTHLYFPSVWIYKQLSSVLYFPRLSFRVHIFFHGHFQYNETE